MQCPQCHKENKAGRKFCSTCGSTLPLSCSSCGFDNEPDDQFCGGCGKAVAPSSPPPAISPQSTNPKHWTPHHLAERILAEQTAIATRADTESERKTITALFADVAGFTTLTQALDPEDARQLIDPALHLMMDAVHRYDGYVAQSLGDGIFALFGAPIAHEDHAQRALYAALRMQEEMRRYADRYAWRKESPYKSVSALTPEKWYCARFAKMICMSITFRSATVPTSLRAWKALLHQVPSSSAITPIS